MSDGRDGERIVSEFTGDPEMAELIEMFVSELPERIGALEDAWQAQSIEETRRIAHQLKGASGGYGFAILGEVAAELEKTLESSETDMGKAKAELDELISMCNRVSF